MRGSVKSRSTLVDPDQIARYMLAARIVGHDDISGLAAEALDRAVGSIHKQAKAIAPRLGIVIPPRENTGRKSDTE